MTTTDTAIPKDHASDVLYPAIRAAMLELQALHPGFNDAVNRAYNRLHRAFWSETPAPASEPLERPELPGTDGPMPAEDCDDAIEGEIQAMGKTAPRVTPADLKANIVHTEIVKHVSHSGQVLRWAVLTTRSGFAVTGSPSASVSPENDIPEFGENMAIENATQSLWPLMGYALKEKLANQPKAKIFICGVDCHQGDDNCNGYCIGKAPHAKLIEA